MESWNDDRLDELSGRVDAGFAKVDQEMKAGFAKVDQEMKMGFARVDHELKMGFAKVDQEVKAGFAELRAANERLYRMLFISAVSVVGVLIAALAAALTT